MPKTRCRWASPNESDSRTRASWCSSTMTSDPTRGHTQPALLDNHERPFTRGLLTGSSCSAVPRTTGCGERQPPRNGPRPCASVVVDKRNNKVEVTAR